MLFSKLFQEEPLTCVLCCVCAAVDFSQGPKFYWERWCQNKLTAKMPFSLSGKLKRNVSMQSFQHDFCLILFAFQLFNLFFFSSYSFVVCILPVVTWIHAPGSRQKLASSLTYSFGRGKQYFVLAQRTEPSDCVGHHQKPVLDKLINCLFSVLYLTFCMYDLYSYFPAKNILARPWWDFLSGENVLFWSS